MTDRKQLEEKINYSFQNPDLLKQAVTHSSFANEQKINREKDYERLEFLGDAVLELVSSSYIFHHYQDMPEGKMSKFRSALVCEPALAEVARNLELGRYLRLGKGEEAGGGRERESIIADIVEAIIGAIYLDGGFDKAKDFIEAFVLSDLEKKQLFYDSKTVLQEIVQSSTSELLHYEVLAEKGPEHNKEFTAAAYLGDRLLGEGSGKSKKAAEQQAAYQAILVLKKTNGRYKCI